MTPGMPDPIAAPERPPAAVEDRSVGMGVANFAGTLAGLVPTAALVGLHYLVHGAGGFEAVAWGSLGQPWVFLPALAVGVVAHEVVHGVGWAVAGRVPFRAMRFGVRWLTPFAHCTVPLPVRAYRIGGAAPGVLVGVLPALLGTALGVGGLAAFGWVLTLTAGGDLLLLWLLRDVPPGATVEDHPTRAGCLVRNPTQTPTKDH